MYIVVHIGLKTKLWCSKWFYLLISCDSSVVVTIEPKNPSIRTRSTDKAPFPIAYVNVVHSESSNL